MFSNYLLEDGEIYLEFKIFTNNITAKVLLTSLMHLIQIRD